MTVFIESIATHQLLPPFRSEKVRVHGFIIPIDAKAIQKYCDKFFNIGAGDENNFHYAPLEEFPFGVICLSEYPRVWSARPNELLGMAADSDHLAQNEIFAVIPVLRYRRSRANLLSDPEVQWIQPLIVIDNATSTFSSREVLGVEALHGTFGIEAGSSEVGFKADVALPSWREFRPNSLQQTLPFLRMSFGAALAPDSPERTDPQMLALLAAVNKAVALPEDGETFPARDMKLVVLKQYRDARDPMKAIYQALVTARCAYSNMEEIAQYSASAVSLQYTPSAMMDQMIQRFLDQRDLADVTPAMEQGAPQAVSLKVLMGFSFRADQIITDLQTQHEFRY